MEVHAGLSNLQQLSSPVNSSNTLRIDTHEPAFTQTLPKEIDPNRTPVVNTPVCCRRISIPKLIRIFCCFCLKANPGGELPDKVEIRVLHSSKHIKTQPSRTQVIHRLETSEKENLERLEERTYTGEYEETYCGEIMYGKTTSSKQQDCTGNLDEDIPNFFMNCYLE